MLDHRDPRTEAGEELRELRADRSAAQHCEARGNLVRRGRLEVCPVVDRVEAVHLRNRRPGARRDDETVVGQLGAVDLDDPRPGDASLAAELERSGYGTFGEQPDAA